MTSKILFPERLSALRKEHQLTQKELGEVFGLSAKAISTMENGERGTTIEKLIAISDYFNVSSDYLLGISENRKRR